MIVVGIDPSLTNTGIVALHTGTPVVLRSIGHQGRDGATYGERSDRIVSLCRAIVTVLTEIADTHGPPGLAVIEGPAYGHNLPSAHDRAGLWWGLYSALRAKNTPTAVVAPGTRAKWATGHGRAPKAEVLATVRSWWPNTRIANHDIADAAVLALMGALYAGHPMPFPIKPRHRTALDTVVWPVLAEVPR